MPRGQLLASIELVCAVCGETFRAKTTGQKYCKTKCKNLGGARLRKVRNEQRSERRCYGCRKMIPSDGFTSATKSYCAACDREYAKGWGTRNRPRLALYKRRAVAKAAATDPDYYRKQTLKKFDMTLDDFDRMLREQGGRCANPGCRTDEPGGRHGTFHVDHDQTHCGYGRGCPKCVRGLLCNNCNLMIGHARDTNPAIDSVVVLRGAADYLAAARAAREV